MTDDVTFVRRELLDMLPRYLIVRDCVKLLVKSKGQVYLPAPSNELEPQDNDERYATYLLRAMFYAVTSRTLAGMVGQIFASPVEIKLPSALEFMREDATGSGLSLEQLSKDTLYDTVSVGRAGLYTDFPVVSGQVTQKQINDGEVRPTLTAYAPEAIINWREGKRGAKTVKTLVVLKEIVDEEGTFSTEQVTQYRELRLVEGVYTVQLHRVGSDNIVGRFGETIIPRDKNGNTFSEIPFDFVGANNNDTSVDEPPLLDLAEVNIAHYRNSADYEEACFIVGQPTPWFSGLTEDWVNDVLHGKVLLGSRAAVLLPENSQAGLLQVQANSMPMEAMKHKEAQMVALGARLVENRAVRRTLGEVQQSNASETSILATCANNASVAYTRALQRAALYVGADPSECLYELPTDFAITGMTAEEQMQLIADMQAGALSYTEVRAQLRRAGLASQDDDVAKAEIDKTATEKADREAKAAAAVKPVVDPIAGVKKPDNRSK